MQGIFFRGEPLKISCCHAQAETSSALAEILPARNAITPTRTQLRRLNGTFKGFKLHAGVSWQPLISEFIYITTFTFHWLSERKKNGIVLFL